MSVSFLRIDGCDMQAKYRETSLGGLARIYRAPLKKS